MLENKTYKRLEVSIVEMDKADVITASGVTVSWGSTWGKNWDDYNVKEDWQ